MKRKAENSIDTSILTSLPFQAQEMRIEHTINIIRGVGAAIIGILNILFFGVYKGVINTNPKTIIAVLIGILLFFGYVFLIHRLSKPGVYRPWLKYLTITIDYILLVSKFAVLGAEKLVSSLLLLAGADIQTTENFVTLTADNVIVFIVIFIIFNFLSALRSGRRIIFYSTCLTMIASVLMLVQADLSEYAFTYVILLTVLSGLLTLAISTKFNTLFAQLQNSARKVQENNVILEEKVDERTKELSRKNGELNDALDNLGESNKKIVDSIEYARRIQNSLLPGKKELEKIPFDHFVIWQPRDIVGGDIYHIDTFEDGTLVALFDCTGHGVPGALITMIALSAIQKITVDEGCLDPALILSRMNTSIKSALHQDSEQATSDDGLDASVLYFDQSNRKLTYAGAKLPMLYVNGEGVVTIKGDRQSIGYKKSDPGFVFRNHVIDIQDGTSVYLFTDGIIDQRGGEKQMPFGRRRFQDILEECHSQTPLTQRQFIENSFVAYRGDSEPVDDMTVIGIQI